MKIQEVADAVENDAVVEIAQRARQDESQGGAQGPVLRRGSPRAPIKNGDGGHDADGREERVRQGGVFSSQAEQRTLVHFRRGPQKQGPKRGQPARSLLFIEIKLGEKFESTGDDNILALLHGSLSGENPALAGAIVQPCENAVS